MTEQEEIASIMQEHGCSMGAASYILLQQRNDSLRSRVEFLLGMWDAREARLAEAEREQADMVEGYEAQLVEFERRIQELQKTVNSRDKTLGFEEVPALSPEAQRAFRAAVQEIDGVNLRRVKELEAKLAEAGALLADAQVAYVARGMELRDAEARLAEEVKNKKEFERDWLAACDELCNTRSRLAEAEARREADFEVYHQVYMVLLNAGTDKYLGALEQAQALVARLAEAESRQTCEGTQPYICHALATARSRLAEVESRLNLADAEVTMLRHFNADAEALLREARGDYARAMNDAQIAAAVGCNLIELGVKLSALLGKIARIDAHLSREGESHE